MDCRRFPYCSRHVAHRVAAVWLLFVPLGMLSWTRAADETSEPPIRITEIFVDPAGSNTTQAIELFNAGSTAVALDGAVIVSGSQTRALNGLDEVPPGGFVIVRWNQTGATEGNVFFTGRASELNPAQGYVALFKSDRVNDAAALLAYVQWGVANQPRAALAGQAGLWDPTAFLPRAPEGRSMALLPGGSGRSPGEWVSAPAPSLGTINTVPVAGYRGWTLVGGQSAQAPGAAFNTEGSSLELVSVDLDGALQHHRFADEAWSLIDTPGDALLPELVTGADGALELVGVGAGNQILHNRFLFDQWDSLTPTGGQSAMPAALAFNPTASTTELVIVGGDGGLRHGRYNGDQWSSFTPVGGTSSTPPALAFNPQGSRLDLLFAGPDRSLLHSRFSGSAWSPPVATGGQTALRPALVVLADGTLEAVISAIDGSVRHSRFVNGTWQAWQPIPGLRSDLSPTLVVNTRASALELFVVGSDRQVRHVRRTVEGWSLPVSTGAVAAHPVAAVLGARNLVEVVVAGQDRALWHTRFQAPPPPGALSLARDIQPIFNASCALSGCHRGNFPASGMNLAAGESHANTVGVPSSQADLNLIEPGDHQKSYLYHKIAGTQRSVGGSGSRMPQNRSALRAADLEKFRQWINQGAEDN